MVRDARGMAMRRAGVIAWAALLLGGLYLAVAPRPSPAASGHPVPAIGLLDPAQLERRAEAAFERWRQRPGAPDETDDEPANAENAEPIDAYDGLYVGMATTRADGRVVTFKLRVTNGIGSGTLIQRECGTTPITLKVSPTGNVSGLALMFSATCLKTELAIRAAPSAARFSSGSAASIWNCRSPRTDARPRSGSSRWRVPRSLVRRTSPSPGRRSC